MEDYEQYKMKPLKSLLDVCFIDLHTMRLVNLIMDTQTENAMRNLR